MSVPCSVNVVSSGNRGGACCSSPLRVLDAFDATRQRRLLPRRTRGSQRTLTVCEAPPKRAQGAQHGQQLQQLSGGAQSQQQILGLVRQLGLAASCVGLCCSLLIGTPGVLLGEAGAKSKLDRDEIQTIELFKRNTPSVVYITNLAVRRDAFTLDFMEIPQGAGSGFIWDKQGHVVTNYHVVKGASDVQITLTGGKEYTAAVVGFDADKDVAVLKIENDGEDLRPVTVGGSGDLQVGQRVYAIGNPFGLDHTLTTGVISGTGREIASGINGRPISDVIQTDAAINPGNSGGPLLDSQGELIGINTAIYSPSGANSGVGFAIPVDLVRSSVEQILKFGKVVRPIVGISFAPDAAVEQLGVKGVLVLDAREGGPAFKAGLKGTSRDDYGRLVLGDIIVAFNGNPVKSASDLYRSLDKCRVGDTVALQVLRGSAKEDVKLTLEASS